MKRLAASLALLLVAAAVSGCVSPFRVHVPDAVVAQSPMDWNETREPEAGGFFGVQSKETRYAFQPDGGTPYPGVMQVFSLRGWSSLDDEELLQKTRQAVAAAVEEQDIDIDERQDEQGKRRLKSGIQTQWFSHVGVVSQEGTLFDEDVTVRIVGEVGHDDRSRTSFVVVAMAQVAETSGIIIPREQSDERTWIQLVGDPHGSVRGATSQTGFIHHLRSHG